MERIYRQSARFRTWSPYNPGQVPPPGAREGKGNLGSWERGGELSRFGDCRLWVGRFGGGLFTRVGPLNLKRLSFPRFLHIVIVFQIIIFMSLFGHSNRSSSKNWQNNHGVFKGTTFQIPQLVSIRICVLYTSGSVSLFITRLVGRKGIVVLFTQPGLSNLPRINHFGPLPSISCNEHQIPKTASRRAIHYAVLG